MCMINIVCVSITEEPTTTTPAPVPTTTTPAPGNVYFILKSFLDKHCNEDVEWVNIKFCALCPSKGCGKINQKTGIKNMLTCSECNNKFCYICNNPISSTDHYINNNHCREESDPFDDL